MNRTLDFRIERNIVFRRNGEIHDGLITVGGIEKVERLNCWACKWSVSEIHPKEIASYGEDPLQALNLCILALDKLVRSAEENGCEIWWLEPGDHCGLLSELYMD